MGYYVRKVELVRWEDFKNFKDLPAETIVKDLRANNNELSVWEIDSLNELEDVAIAFATCGDKKITVELVAIEQEKVRGKLEVSKSPSKTPYIRFKAKHCNICNLTFETLGKFAQMILDSKEDSKLCCEVDFNTIKSKVSRLIGSGQMTKKGLSDTFLI